MLAAFLSALRTARRHWTSAKESNATAVCFAAAYDRHHPLPIQATPLPEKIPAHATKRNFRASIIENNRNRHDLWAKRLSSPCLQGCSCCTHPRRRRRTRKVPRCKLHDRDGRIRRRRQIPGKRISSVLLYGRLHLRQALVSRSRHPSLRLFRFSTI